MPPISELGTTYFVPPIGGIPTGAGYNLRIVATDANTQVTTSITALGFVNINRVLNRGEYVELYITRSNILGQVTCSKPCLVAQYNRGVFGYPSGVSKISNTSPYMTVLTPVDHFVSATCFATANWFDTFQNVNDYWNYVTVVTTTAGPPDILFDGKQLVTCVTTPAVAGYVAYTCNNISHGSHTINVRAGSTTTFAAYAYGHAVLNGVGHSGYGYNAGYQFIGAPVGTYVPPPTPPPTTQPPVTRRKKKCGRRYFSAHHRVRCDLPGPLEMRIRQAQRYGWTDSRFWRG
jgi:hypothetical protein